MLDAGCVRLVSSEIVKCPPSVVDGTFTLEEEANQRSYGCGWIQKASILLRIPAETLVSGQTIFHRFYYRRSMKEFDLKLVAAASLYLGCKLCETPRRIRDVVHIVVFLDWVEKKDEFLEILKKKQQLNNGAAEFSESLKDDEIKQPIFETSNQIETQTNSINAEELNIDSKLALYQVEQISVMLRNMEKEIHLPDINSKEFRRTKTNIHRVERHILRETGFMISQTLIHPHRYILQFIHILFSDKVLTPDSKSMICQRAWGYLNDSLRTPLCCTVQPSAMATAAIYMASTDYGIELPSIIFENKMEDGRIIEMELEWFEGFQVEKTELHRVVETIRQLYNNECNPKYKQVAYPPVPVAVISTTNETDLIDKVTTIDSTIITPQTQIKESKEIVIGIKVTPQEKN